MSDPIDPGSDLDGELRTGQTYRIAADDTLDGILLIDPAQRAAAYLAADGSFCATRDHIWTLELERYRLGWGITCRDASTRRVSAHSRLTIVNNHHITAGETQTMRLWRTPTTTTWRLTRKGGLVARIDAYGLQDRVLFSPTMIRAGRRAGGELTVAGDRSSSPSLRAAILLALATIRADLTIPAIDAGGGGG